MICSFGNNGLKRFSFDECWFALCLLCVSLRSVVGSRYVYDIEMVNRIKIFLFIEF